jgi:hypothetical protein
MFASSVFYTASTVTSAILYAFNNDDLGLMEDDDTTDSSGRCMGATYCSRRTRSIGGATAGSLAGSGVGAGIDYAAAKSVLLALAIILAIYP